MSLPHPRRPGTTYLVTRSTSQRLMRLLPRGKRLKQLLRYALFKSAAKHGVELHAYCVMSNHIHICATDVHGTIPDFARDAFSLIGRVANSLHRVKCDFWDKRPTSYVEIEDADTMWRKLVYTIVNPVTAILVRTCTEWPGVITTPGRTCRKVKAKRPKTAFFRRSKMPQSVDFELTMPPQLAHLAPDAFRHELGRRVAAREAEIRTSARRRGLRFMGARKLLRQDRFSAPRNTSRTSGRTPTLAGTDVPRRRERIRALQKFRSDYREARKRWLAGARDVLFPHGTFQLRHAPNVQVAGPCGAT